MPILYIVFLFFFFHSLNRCGLLYYKFKSHHYLSKLPAWVMFLFWFCRVFLGSLLRFPRSVCARGRWAAVENGRIVVGIGRSFFAVGLGF